MAKKTFTPFANEADCLQLGELTIENRLDRISLFGSIDLTLDKEGLQLARRLHEILALTLAQLEQAELPDKITVIPAETVANPFA